MGKRKGGRGCRQEERKGEKRENTTGKKGTKQRRKLLHTRTGEGYRLTGVFEKKVGTG